MLSFVTLFLEHFFTTPTDVVASTLAILLVLSPLRDKLSRFGVWYDLFYAYNLALLIISLSSLLLVDEAKTRASIQNRAALHLKRFSTYFGQGRFLFFVLFVLTLFFYVDNQSKEFIILFVYAAIILLIDPKTYVMGLAARDRKYQLDIGDIIGVQSRNTFLAKLYKKRVPVRRFDFVEFQYSMGDSENEKIGDVHEILTS